MFPFTYPCTTFIHPSFYIYIHLSVSSSLNALIFPSVHASFIHLSIRPFIHELNTHPFIHLPISHVLYCCLIGHLRAIHLSHHLSSFRLSAFPSILLFTDPNIDSTNSRFLSDHLRSCQLHHPPPRISPANFYFHSRYIKQLILSIPNRREVSSRLPQSDGCLPNSSQMLSFSSSVGCSNVSLQ